MLLLYKPISTTVPLSPVLWSWGRVFMTLLELMKERRLGAGPSSYLSRDWERATCYTSVPTVPNTAAHNPSARITARVTWEHIANAATSGCKEQNRRLFRGLFSFHKHGVRENWRRRKRERVWHGTNDTYASTVLNWLFQYELKM